MLILDVTPKQNIPKNFVHKYNIFGTIMEKVTENPFKVPEKVTHLNKKTTKGDHKQTRITKANETQN